MLRIGKYVFDARPSTHGLRHQTHVWQLQLLDQSGEITGELLRIGNANFAARRVSAMGKCDASLPI
jgi:hypothetical protein